MERELERNGKGRKRMEKELLAELKALRDNRGEEEDGGTAWGPFWPVVLLFSTRGRGLVRTPDGYGAEERVEAKGMEGKGRTCTLFTVVPSWRRKKRKQRRRRRCCLHFLAN